MVLAKCYCVTFKITNVKETIRSLERHSATKRCYVSPCKHCISNVVYDQLATKTYKSISLRPKSIFLYTELLYTHFLFYRHAMLPANYMTFKDHLLHRRTHRYKKVLRIFLRGILQTVYDQLATKRSPWLESSRRWSKPAATESSGSWFTSFRGGIAVIALAWNHLVQIRLVLTWRFTQLVKTGKYIYYLIKGLTRMCDFEWQWKIH